MTEDLFHAPASLEDRMLILELKVEEILRIVANDRDNAPSYSCNYPSADFLSFWESYPRKKAMKPAWAAWRKCRTRPPVEEILAALKKQKKSRQWQQGIIPLPATWINQERWDDEE